MIRPVAAVVAVCAFLALPMFADDKGQGFIVTADEATIYKNAESDQVLGSVAKGDAMAGFRGFYDSGHNNSWIAVEKNDRLWITFLKPNSKGNLIPVPGWVKKADVVSFSYECGCGPKTQAFSDKGDPCNPTRQQGKLANAAFSWNLCFTDGRDAKVTAMAAAAPAAAPAQPSVEERLAKLKELLDKGILTKEEYERKRADILNSL